MTSNPEQDERIVRVGMVGTSWWADAMHLPAVSSHPQAKVTAICGRNRDNAQKMANTWQIPHVFTDWEAMLDSGEIDAVVISTPNDTHYPITMKAIENGLHVLCEKPTALNYADAKRMADAADAAGIKHFVPFTYRFMPTSRYLKELIHDGYLGKPYHLNMRYYTGFARDGAYMWRFDKKYAGSGVIGDLGSHFLYLARWFFGEIKSVSCTLSHTVPRQKNDPDGNEYEIMDDVALIHLQFENGAVGSIQVSAVCYEDTPFGQTHHMEFHGSDGTLYSFTDWNTVQEVRGAKVGEGVVKPMRIPDHIWGKARRDTVPNTYKDMFRVEDFMARDFINAILENRLLSPNLDDGAAVQRLVDAAVKSHETGCRVEVAG